jgi:hypothetical protein
LNVSASDFSQTRLAKAAAPLNTRGGDKCRNEGSLTVAKLTGTRHGPASALLSRFASWRTQPLPRHGTGLKTLNIWVQYCPGLKHVRMVCIKALATRHLLIRALPWPHKRISDISHEDRLSLQDSWNRSWVWVVLAAFPDVAVRLHGGWGSKMGLHP